MTSFVTNTLQTFLVKSDLKYRQFNVFLLKNLLDSLWKILEICRKPFESTLKTVSGVWRFESISL